jgi:hypothetical protein
VRDRGEGQGSGDRGQVGRGEGVAPLAVTADTGGNTGPQGEGIEKGLGLRLGLASLASLAGLGG